MFLTGSVMGGVLILVICCEIISCFLTAIGNGGKSLLTIGEWALPRSATLGDPEDEISQIFSALI